MKNIEQHPDNAQILSPEEMSQMLHNAPPDLIQVLAIGAFSDIRMNELGRLDWSAVDLDRGIIELGADQTKSGSPRVIPVNDNLASWLEPLERKGKVIPSVMKHQRAVASLAASLDIDWPRNVLRRSFIVHNAGDQADKWFGIRPNEGRGENLLHRCDLANGDHDAPHPSDGPSMPS